MTQAREGVRRYDDPRAMSSSRKLSSALILAALAILVALWMLRRCEPSLDRPDETTNATPDDSGTPGAATESRPPDRGKPRDDDSADGDDTDTRGWIAGTIVDGGGRPIPGAEVRVSRMNVPPARAGSDGRFRAPAIAGELHDLRAEAGGFGVETRVSIPSGVDNLIIRLRRPIALRGVVLFPDGSPPARARVEARAGRAIEADPFARRRAIDDDRPAESTATCDSAGAFELAGLAPGRYFLSASGPGIRAPSGLTLATAEKDSPSVTLEVQRGRAVGGVVVGPDAARVTDAEIRIVSVARESRLSSTVRTNAQGEFLIDTLPTPPWRLEVRPGGSLRDTMIDVGEDRRDLKIELESGHSLAGSVLDARTREPIAGADVSAPSSSRRTSTDGAGEFKLTGLEEGAPRIEVRASGYATARFDPDADGGVVVTLSRAGRLGGVVVDTRMNGVPNVEIELLQWEPDATALGHRTIAEARSDPDGAFELELGDVREGPRYSLRVRHADFPIFELHTLDLHSPVAGHEDLVIELAAAGSIAGSIRDEDRVLVGVPVRLIASREGGDAELHHVAFSGADGRFRLQGVPPGTYSIRVDSASHAPFLTSRLVVHAGEETVADLELDAPKTISGRVVGPDGEPVRASIEAVDLKAPTIQRGRRSARTDQSGRFVLDALHHGPYRLRISAPRFAAAAREDVRAPTENIEVVLRPFGSMVGRVVDKETGDAVSRFRVSAIPLEVGMRLEETLRPWTVESADGRFERNDIPPGPYRLTIDAIDFLPRSVEVLVPSGRVAVETRVDLERGGAVHLSISDSDARPLSDVRTRAIRVRGNSRPGLDGSETQDGGTTDSSGKVTLGGLRPGRWVVEVEADGYLRERTGILQVRVDESIPPPTVLLTLRRGATIRGIARDAKGLPLADGTVVLLGKGQPRTMKAADDGSYEFRGLSTGRYRLQVARKFGDRGPFVDVRIEENGVTIVRDLETP